MLFPQSLLIVEVVLAGREKVGVSGSTWKAWMDGVLSSERKK